MDKRNFHKLNTTIYIYSFLLLITLIICFFILRVYILETNGGWTKFDRNPVLGGKLGIVFDVSVLQEEDLYRMWFSWRPKDSIALTESKDGVHWSEPVIVLGPNKASGWENRVNRPVILKHSGKYHMWYTGQTDNNSYIGYAISPHGIKWTRASEKPVLSPDQPWEKGAVMVPHVNWDDKEQIFKMWYSGGEQYEPDAIGYATSTDGYTWIKYPEPVFLPSEGSGWDNYKVAGGQVLQLEGWHIMFYIGFKDIDHAMIGLARSPDGVNNWERHPANPIIKRGAYRAWDSDAVYKPFAVKSDNIWYLWYNGRHGGIEQIGLATHKGEDFAFDEAN